ncbi:DSBA oxidoreductase [Advenella kashmirensis WT001]|uniref:2-hydroxychromene-2-carboxylate isomerase n=1 Tax=Advenella kashmirensis (strain DSM 17095 / LMG 22695 / WT001) TaxID=1036672 RepID=I3U844_ADVKW|nr:2-hydroxychromene-2-carboxylate isomerase [Advenella kashmirensis]AFK61182.1 DSBA oxidoreductase [Advenella kashmirensis WT001]
MQTPSIDFLFDFGSPNAYFCHKVIPDIEARTGKTFRYVPILLGGLFKLTNNQSPANAFAHIANKRAYDALEVERFIKKHKLDQYRRNPYWPVNTLKIMRGAIAAEKLGIFDAYVDAVFSCMWELELDMSDTDTILRALEQAGLDGAAIMDLSQQSDIKQRLIDNTQQACDRGAFGSPTFFVGDEIYFGKDRLAQVEEKINEYAATTR